MKPKLRFSNFINDYEIKDVSDITSNISSGKISKQLEDGEYNVYGSMGIIGKSNFYDYAGEKVLVARVGANAGSVNKINEKCCISDNTLVLEPKDILNDYLYYALSHYNPKKLIFGSGQPLVTGGQLKKIKLGIPSKEEQLKVSNFLSLLDKKIELQSKKIEDLKLFKKGLLNVISKEITESKTIKEICEYKNGNSYEEYVCDEGKYNLISLNSVDINGNLKNDMKKIKLSNPDTLIKNDIVMVLSDVAHGDFLGVSALIDEDNKYVLNQRMGLLRIMDNSIPQFIVEMINNEQRKFKILGQGSSQLNLSKDDILNQKIKYPCIISQKKYATIFNNINTGLKLNKEKLIKLQELKKGLMQNMFV